MPVRPACVANRWGQGTCESKESNEPAVKEMNAKLAALKAERDKQDQQLSNPTTLKNQKQNLQTQDLHPSLLSP